MGREVEETRDELHKLYDEIPEGFCKGLCQKYCGPVVCLPAEAKVIEARQGSLPAPLADLTCNKLIDGKCSIYEDRPFICRVFGAVKSERMRCPHGCKPKGGFLNRRRSDKIIVKINKIDE